MALVGVSITKRVAFRNSTQEFSNIYHYTYVGVNPGAGLAEQIVDELVRVEKLLHASSVSFIRARLWSAGGTIAENTMIFQKALTGTGSVQDQPEMDRERAVLVQWAAGKDRRGRPVRLKKWFHSCGRYESTLNVPVPVLANQDRISAAGRDAVAVTCRSFSPITIGTQQYALCSERGRLTEGLQGVTHPYLEHHQLGDQWRG